MGLLSKLIPTNVLEEKQHFFDDQHYNPQFVYEEPVTLQKLQEYGVPRQPYLQLAERIVKEAYFGRNEQDLWMMEGSEISQADVEKKIRAFLAMHGLEKRFQLIWSSTFITRAAITTDTIKLRLPCTFRKEGLISVIYHEIGTHALRRINYEQQPWYKKKKTFGFGEYLYTEEGLASLHSLLPRSFKSAFNSALRYLCVAWAQEHSFSELWQLLTPYVQDPNRRWDIVIRQKRGMSDTSQPGGFTKDLCYFQGMVDVWRWLSEREFDVTPLYYGKLALEDVERAQELNPEFEPQLPSFFTLSHHKYAKQLQQIGEINHFGK